MKPLKTLTRRTFIKWSGKAAAIATGLPCIHCGRLNVSRPMTRSFGKLDMEVTTLGLGGQASIQWTPAGVDPVQIILKAFHLGINYFDTSNLYGPSQMNYGKAFRRLHLIPGSPDYNERLRRSFFLTSKTHVRFGKGLKTSKGLVNATNGIAGSTCVDDLRRSLSQIFGDGKGNYPQGAYLDMVLIHSLSTPDDLEAVYEGYDRPDPKSEHIGALAALLDFRDGTNLTGLNPDEETLIRHIGFSGHRSAPLMMEMIRRDTRHILDGMLVAINANDRLYLNMQHNVIPVAAARNMGVIAMKAFADGAMYSKDAVWSYMPSHVVRSVGSHAVPSRSLIAYALATTGVHTLITGIGQISDDSAVCQLTQNLSAAQIRAASLRETDRLAIEDLTAKIKNGKTNYFQMEAEELSPPRACRIGTEYQQGREQILITWDTAYAGSEPVVQYDVMRDGQKTGQVIHHPQIDATRFRYAEEKDDTADHVYRIVTVDKKGNRASSDPLRI